MKKKTGAIKILFGKFGVEPYEVQTEKDITVGKFLEEERISLEAGEKVWVNGEKASLKDILESGDIVNVVAAKEGGR